MQGEYITYAFFRFRLDTLSNLICLSA